MHDAGVSLDDLASYRRFADAGKLPLRVYAMADGAAVFEITPEAGGR